MFERNSNSNELQFIIPNDLNCLKLFRQKIDDEKTKAIAEVLKVNISITFVDLHSNHIGPEGAAAIAEALKVNTSITSVNLRDNQIGAEGAKAIAEVLKVNKNITFIDLSDNHIGDEGAKAIAEVLKVNKNITFIDLSDNHIGDEGAKVIAEVLKVNKNITFIDLSDNYIGYEGVKVIAEALKVNKNITSIELGNNQIGAEGAKVIVEVLKVNPSITSINLRNNQIGAEGAAAIAEALKVNTSITSVDLSYNQIGAEGAAAIAEALKVNTSITSVDLSHNQIGDEGAKAIAEALKVNTSITSVDLSYNQIGEEGLTSLIDAILQSSSILHCKLPRESELSDSIREHLANNANKLKENCDKLSSNTILTSQQYHTSLSQLNYFRQAGYINNSLFPFLKNMNLGKTIEDLSQQIKVNLFPLKGVCKAENPLYKLYNVPMDVFLKVSSFIPLQAIKSHQKSIIEPNDNQNVLSESEVRVKEVSYTRKWLDFVTSTVLVTTPSIILLATALEEPGLPIMIALVVGAIGVMLKDYLSRPATTKHAKDEKSFVERITQGKEMITIGRAT